jgi:hypothetical protein
MFFSLIASICFVVCHGGPADQLATFAENLSKEGETVEIYATGPALKKFQERGVPITDSFSLENLSSEEERGVADQMAKRCSHASTVITDVGHPFDIQLQHALSRFPQVRRLAYYDNFEAYVPGGYSVTAAATMLASEGILFANAHLAHSPLFQEEGKEIDLGSRKKIGIGYYPIHQAEKIAKRRALEQAALRQELFSRHHWIDKGQKILVYFGGNNEEYFSKAFPAFLSLLTQLHSSPKQKRANTSFIILVQQHPGAKNKNIDGEKLSQWVRQQTSSPMVILSDLTSDEAQIIANGAFYYQTSLAPQFVLAGIPTMQIGHKTFPDILVRNKIIPSITKREELILALKKLSHSRKEIPQQKIYEGLGIQENWLTILKSELLSHQ